MVAAAFPFSKCQAVGGDGKGPARQSRRRCLWTRRPYREKLRTSSKKDWPHCTKSATPRLRVSFPHPWKYGRKMGLPSGHSLKFYLYSGAGLGTGCRLKVSDFHQDGEQATIQM